MSFNDCSRGLLAGLTALGLVTRGYAVAAAGTISAKELRDKAHAAALEMAALPATLIIERTEYRDPTPLLEAMRKRPDLSKTPEEKEQREFALRIQSANAHHHDLVEYKNAKGGRQYLAVYHELRDISALLRENNLPEDQAPHLSPELREVLVNPSGDSLLVGDYHQALGFVLVDQYPANTHTSSEPPLADAAGEWFLTWTEHVATKIEETQEDHKAVLKVTWSAYGTSGAGTFDPAMDYRLLHLELRDKDGNMIQEESASQYRRLGGIPYPFKFTHAQYNKKTHKLENELTLNVREAHFNAELKPDDFLIGLPEGTMIEYSVREKDIDKMSADRLPRSVRMNLSAMVLFAQKKLRPEDLPPGQLPIAATQTAPAK